MTTPTTPPGGAEEEEVAAARKWRDAVRAYNEAHAACRPIEECSEMGRRVREARDLYDDARARNGGGHGN